jgi:hypothetical protein
MTPRPAASSRSTGAPLEHLSVTNESDGTTILYGPVADQAVLHGLLEKVRDLGLPLVSVTQVQPDQPVFYLITFISIPTLAPYGPVKNHRLRSSVKLRGERGGPR